MSQTKIIDAQALAEELKVEHQSAFKGEGAHEPLKFSRGLLSFLGASITTMARHIAKRSAAAHDDLERRVAELEAGPLRYEGVHVADKSYSRGAFVTHSGSIWHCNSPTTSRPGDDPSWTLACKRGSDAR